MTLDFQFSLLRGAIAVLALGLVLVGLRRDAAGGRARRLRIAALAALGLAAYAAYFYFFALRLPSGFHSRDVFHYYLGSKYFPELGYYRLYDCALGALVEEGVQELDELPYVRNLRNLRAQDPRAVMLRAQGCPARFGEARWREFKRDVVWLRDQVPPRVWRELMTDHGYHPPPVWTLMGRAAASHAPVGSDAFRWMIRADRLLVAAALLALVWAFGLEVAALAAVAWGTGYMWRYGWIGDSMLRQLWFAAALGGIAALRRGADATGGALLAGSALVRVFPGVFAAGALLHAARRAWDRRRLRLDGGVVRFLLGAAGAAALLVPLSLWAAGDAGVYLAFLDKMSRFADSYATNRVGFGVLVHPLLGSPALVTAARLLASCVFVWLFWRALPGLERWEAAALGFAAIPVLSDPTNYYHSFVVAGVVLAERRPRAAVLVLLACIAWTANGLVFYLSESAHRGDSAIAVCLSFATVWLAGRPAARRAASAEPAPEPAAAGARAAMVEREAE